MNVLMLSMLQHKRIIFRELLNYFLMKKFLFYNYMYKCLASKVEPSYCNLRIFLSQLDNILRKFLNLLHSITGALAETDCMDCPPGQYCEGTGNVFPTGFCDEGFWCGGKSFQRRPYDTGNLTVINGTTK